MLKSKYSSFRDVLRSLVNLAIGSGLPRALDLHGKTMPPGWQISNG
jgi:hypothetical protein